MAPQPAPRSSPGSPPSWPWSISCSSTRRSSLRPAWTPRRCSLPPALSPVSAAFWWACWPTCPSPWLPPWASTPSSPSWWWPAWVTPGRSVWVPSSGAPWVCWSSPCCGCATGLSPTFRSPCGSASPPVSASWSPCSACTTQGSWSQVPPPWWRWATSPPCPACWDCWVSSSSASSPPVACTPPCWSPSWSPPPWAGCLATWPSRASSPCRPALIPCSASSIWWAHWISVWPASSSPLCWSTCLTPPVPWLASPTAPSWPMTRVTSRAWSRLWWSTAWARSAAPLWVPPPWRRISRAALALPSVAVPVWPPSWSASCSCWLSSSPLSPPWCRRTLQRGPLSMWACWCAPSWPG